MGSKRKAPAETKKMHDIDRDVQDTRKPAEKSRPAPNVAADGGRKDGGIKMPSLSFRLTNTRLFLAGILLLALIIRLLPTLYSIVNGRVVFAEFDPYYHMRRIVYSVDHFPFVNSYDSYVNFPNGYVVGWPALFDLIAAAFSIIVGLGSPGRFTIEIASSLVPVLLGLLTIVLAYLLVKDVINEKAALFTSLVMAVMWGAVYTQLFGYVGHHVLEIVVLLAMYLLFMRGVSSARAEGLDFSSIFAHKKPLAYAVLAGIAIAAAFFSWDGAVVYIGVLIAYAFVQFVYDAYTKDNSSYLAVVGAVASIVALLIVAPFAIISDMGRGFQFSMLYLSWFQIVFLLSMAISFAAMGVLSKVTLDRKMPWPAGPVAAVVIGAVALAAVLLAMPSFYGTLLQGIEFLTGSNTVLSAINEISPLFTYNGGFSVEIPWVYFSSAGVLAILGSVAFLISTIPGRKIKNGEIFLLVWTALVLVLGLMQSRFVYLLSVSVSVFAGYMIYKAFEITGLFEAPEKHPARKKDPAGKSKSRSAEITPPIVAVLIVAAIAILPMLWGSATAASTNLYYYTTDWCQACQWVDANTPQTSYVYSADVGTNPEYGIMSWWDYGDYILYEAERPAVANNFQTGIPAASHYFISQDEASANTIMDRVKAKYVMVDYRQGSSAAGVSGGIFDNMPLLAGDDTGSYVMSYSMPVPYGSQRQYDGSAKYYGTMYSRLFNGDALGGKDPLGYTANGLQHYRLLYMTQGVDPVKVFEYVKGATITGTASPGAAVMARLNVTMADGAHTYYASTTAGADGSFSFTVPYPTSATVGTTKTGAAYVLTSGTSSAEVQVPAAAVDSGTSVAGGKL